MPRSKDYKSFVGQYYEDSYRPALSGGEDYELLFTSNEFRREEIQKISEKLNIPITEIGIITDSGQIDVATLNGKYKITNNRGFVHFNN